MKKHIKIDGMSCEHCAKAVKSAMEELGAEKVDVNVIDGYAEAVTDALNDEIRNKISDEGFTVRDITEIN